jgi:hypothetical protein
MTFPTAVQTNPIILSNPGSVNSASSDPAICLSGNTHDVQPGETCDSIAAATNTATGTLRILNNLFPDCSNLLEGTTLYAKPILNTQNQTKPIINRCLPHPCLTHTVQPHDTCWSVALSQGIPFTTLLGYNPTLNTRCTNLISGSSICLTPPAGLYTPIAIPNATGTPHTGPYATVAVAAPTPVANGTITGSSCGGYYQAHEGDTCAKISMRASIGGDLFRAVNPSVREDCAGLVAGVYYCVSPVQGWDWNGDGNGKSDNVSVSAAGGAASAAAAAVPTSPLLALVGKGRLSDLIWLGINW